jgi:hypothetical protein
MSLYLGDDTESRRRLSDWRTHKKLGTARWEHRQLRHQLSDGKSCGVEGTARPQQGDQDGIQADQACRLVRAENTWSMPTLRPHDAAGIDVASLASMKTSFAVFAAARCIPRSHK